MKTFENRPELTKLDELLKTVSELREKMNPEKMNKALENRFRVAIGAVKKQIAVTRQESRGETNV